MECTSCGRNIPPENINIHLAIAKCDHCGAVFSFYDQLAPPKPGAAPAGLEMEEEILPHPGGPDVFSTAPLPRDLKMEDTGRELRIIRKWFSPQFLFLTVFTALWDLFLVIWFSLAIRSGQFIMAAAGIVHLGVGIGLSYYTLAGYLNSTIVAINPDYIVRYHKPLPWKGAVTLGTEDLDRLVSRRKGDSFSVSALLRDGRILPLVEGLKNASQALQVEEEAGKYLRRGKFRL